MAQNRSTLLYTIEKQYATNKGYAKSPMPRSDKAKLASNALVEFCKDWHFRKAYRTRKFPSIVKIASTTATVARIVYATLLVSALAKYENLSRQDISHRWLRFLQTDLPFHCRCGRMISSSEFHLHWWLKNNSKNGKKKNPLTYPNFEEVLSGTVPLLMLN